MTKKEFTELTLAIYQKYKVKTLFDNSVPTDNGWLIDDEIHLANSYKNPSIMHAIWCHELGHFIIQTRYSKIYDVKSTFQCEFKAWDIAQQIHAQYFGKPFNKNQGNFCLKCLKTYSNTHYDFRHLSYPKKAKTHSGITSSMSLVDVDPDTIPEIPDLILI